MIRAITTEELKKNYMTRNGFIFQAASDCNPENAKLVASTVQAKGYAAELPEFVGHIDNRTFAFVYAEGVSFDTPSFLDDCKRMGAFSGTTRFFHVDALCAWLREK